MGISVLNLLCWVIGLCVVDYALVKFAQQAMDKGKDRTRGEWMLLSLVVKAIMFGLALSTFFWHPEAAQVVEIPQATGSS